MTRDEALKVLGLSAAPSPDEIVRAFAKLGRQWHPDANCNVTPDIREFMEGRMRELRQARDVLLDLLHSDEAAESGAEESAHSVVSHQDGQRGGGGGASSTNTRRELQPKCDLEGTDCLPANNGPKKEVPTKQATNKTTNHASVLVLLSEPFRVLLGGLMAWLAILGVMAGIASICTIVGIFPGLILLTNAAYIIEKGSELKRPLNPLHYIFGAAAWVLLGWIAVGAVLARPAPAPKNVAILNAGQALSSFGDGSVSFAAPLGLRGVLTSYPQPPDYSLALGAQERWYKSGTTLWSAKLHVVKGSDFLRFVTYANESGDESGDGVIGLLAKNGLSRRLNAISFADSNVSDEGLAHLNEFPMLTVLELSSCNAISDGGLRNVSTRLGLRYVEMQSCPLVSDAGVDALAALWQLQALDLSGNRQLSDSALKNFGKLKQLRWLSLKLCGRITPSAVEGLKRALPSLTIDR